VLGAGRERKGYRLKGSGRRAKIELGREKAAKVTKWKPVFVPSVHFGGYSFAVICSGKKHDS
jgi:hypothetical protein